MIADDSNDLRVEAPFVNRVNERLQVATATGNEHCQAQGGLSNHFRLDTSLMPAHSSCNFNARLAGMILNDADAAERRCDTLGFCGIFLSTNNHIPNTHVERVAHLFERNSCPRS